jgi:phosphoserine phosphatase
MVYSELSTPMGTALPSPRFASAKLRPGAGHPPEIVFFDLDGTLVPGPSVEWRFLVELARTGQLGPRALGHSALFALRYGGRFGRHIWKKNKAYLAGMDVADVAARASRWVERSLMPLVRPALRTELDRRHADGAHVVLLTGTPDFIALPLCACLGISDCIATECAVADGRFLPLPPRRHPFGADKLTLADTRCRELGVPLQRAVAYADSMHDVSLLNAVEAVAVHPDRSLRRLAKNRHWVILDA